MVGACQFIEKLSVGTSGLVCRHKNEKGFDTCQPINLKEIVGHLWSSVPKDMPETAEDQYRNTKRQVSSSTNLNKKRRCTNFAVKKRDNERHKMLFKPNGLPNGVALTYIDKGQKLRTGHKKGSSIVCTCCSKEMSPSQFENHIGMGARRQPYRYICTSDNRPLHEIAMSSDDGGNIVIDCDDNCTICQYGENDPIHCTGCHRKFHAGHLNLQCDIATMWRCRHCDPSKNVDTSRNASVGADESESISCVICRAYDFSTDPFNDRTVMICDQCDKEFHVGCLREKKICDLKEKPQGDWFCSSGCSEIDSCLKKMVLRGEERVPHPLPMIQRCARKSLRDEPASHNAQWRILHGKDHDESPLLSRAVEILKEGFGCIAVNGNDLINPMVYGKAEHGRDFSRIYTAFLTVNSHVVSVALFKIFNQQLAELPLVATSEKQKGKGLFQVLFSCLWDLLLYLEVKRLVLPAAEQAISFWTKRYGFTEMSKERFETLAKDFELTLFDKTVMLERDIP